jgi:hypothetical protein
MRASKVNVKLVLMLSVLALAYPGLSFAQTVPAVNSASYDLVKTKDGKVHVGKKLSEAEYGLIFQEVSGAKVLLRYENIQDVQKDVSGATLAASGMDLTAPPSAPPPGQEAAVATPVQPVVASPVSGPTLTSTTEEQEHRHTGLFVALDIAPGYAAVSNGSNSDSVSGLSVDLDAAVGGALVENLILGGEVWASVMTNPTFSGPGFSTGTSNSSVDVYMVGPQLRYYFMPANIYLAGTIGLTVINLSDSGTSISTDVGWGTKAAIGKEWWISSRWAIGLAGRLVVAQNQNQAGATLTTVAATGAFTATFN